MENKEFFIEFKNNGISGDAFVFTEKVDGLDEDAIHAVEVKFVVKILEQAVYLTSVPERLRTHDWHRKLHSLENILKELK